MKLFYVDYENVKDGGLKGVVNLTKKDAVKIFYSDDAQRISFDTHRSIIESQASFEYHKISPDLKTLKNAMDFFLLQEIEKAMEKDKSGEYFIVSDDSDFDGFIGSKLKKKYNIKRIAEICRADAATEEKKKEQALRSYIGKYLKAYKDRKEEIVEAYMTSSARQEFNNKLQKTFSNDEVSDILTILKNLIKNMPGR